MGDNFVSRISDNDKEAKWNIVDVHGDDGLLHRGCIVGVVRGGLVIDFGNEIQEVIHGHGKVYRSRQRTFFSDNENRPASEYRGRLVEVLLRVGPDKPWKWHPGTLLFAVSTRDHAFGLVRVYLPDRTDCIAAPGNRFRTASTDTELQRSMFKEGDLVDYRSVSKVWNGRDIQWYPTALMDGRRVYILSDRSLGFWSSHSVSELNQSVLRCDKRWLFVTDIGEGVLYVKNVIASGAARKRKRKQTDGFWRRLEAYATFAGSLAAEVCRVSCVVLETYLKIDVYDWKEVSVNCLCRSVLSEIIDCLDTLDQAKLWALCKDWHKALTSESARRLVRYTYSGEEDTTHRGEFELADYLLKCWNENTRVIAIRGNGKSPMSQIGRYIKDIMQEKQREPLKQLVLYNHNMEAHRMTDSDNFVDDLRGTLSPLVSVCSTLILKDVRIFRSSPILPIAIQFKHARISAAQLEWDQRTKLWVRLDKSCPNLENNSTLLTWIRNFSDPERTKVYRQYRPTDYGNVAKILTSIQGNDPREDVHYRFKKWQPDQLVALDIGKLTKLTVYALYAVLHHDTMQLEVFW